MNLSQAGVYATPTELAPSGADFYFNHHGSIAVLVAVSPEGQAWVDANVSAEAMHWAGGVVIEQRLVPDMVEFIRGDGLLIGGGY